MAPDSSRAAAAAVSLLVLLLAVAKPAACDDIQPGDLPVKRPRNPATACTYNSCMKGLNISTARGVFYFEMDYKPLRGVNSTHMRWLFDNLHKNVTNPKDGKLWPMYLVFHRADHVYHTADNLDAAGRTQVGTKYRWVELPLNNCTYNRLSATAPWTCTLRRRGVLNGDPVAEWGSFFHTNVLMDVTRYSNSEIMFRAQAAGATVATTRHSWSDSANGLLLRTQQWLGKHTSATSSDGTLTPVFDTGFAASLYNPNIWSTYLSGANNGNAAATNVPNNKTAVAWASALHFLQEYGGLKTKTVDDVSWLALAYAANNGAQLP